MLSKVFLCEGKNKADTICILNFVSLHLYITLTHIHEYQYIMKNEPEKEMTLDEQTTAIIRLLHAAEEKRELLDESKRITKGLSEKVIAKSKNEN